MTPLLLVRDTDTFCDSLLATGVERFIAQTFHFEKGEFVAQTRKQAFDIMAEKLGCPVSQFQPRYVKHYREVFVLMVVFSLGTFTGAWFLGRKEM